MPKPRPALLLTLLAVALFGAALVHRGCRPNPPSDMDALAARLRGAGLTVTVESSEVCYVTDGPRVLPPPINPERYPDTLGRWQGVVYCQRGVCEYGVQAGPWTLIGDPALADRIVRLLS